MHLSLLEHGCYRQMLDQYYLNELPISLDIQKISRLLNARTKDEQDAIQNVLNDFFIKTEDGYVHRRCEVEIEQYNLKSKAAQDNAKKRWDAKAMPTQCEGNAELCEPIANHKPLTINYKPLTNINTIGDFDLFWQAYPKKVGKSAAQKVWNKLLPNIDDCLKAIAWQRETSQWFKNNGQFIPNPATWLNQERWMDEPTLEASF